MNKTKNIVDIMKTSRKISIEDNELGVKIVYSSKEDNKDNKSFTMSKEEFHKLLRNYDIIKNQ
ncbi:MAG: hypothetical protein M1168_02850 [Candidatus Marsarchaeota archaeon]|nr:hypothetical protein [Candidatus Marsarchaeota archaeon]MCL5094895.1 hypothetical protein [Candidatus Marsarchaeota archaeon]